MKDLKNINFIYYGYKINYLKHDVNKHIEKVWYK